MQAFVVVGVAGLGPDGASVIGAGLVRDRVVGAGLWEHALREPVWQRLV